MTAPDTPAASGAAIGDGAAPHDTILSIQVLRGIAAIAVVFYHTHIILGRADYGGNQAFAGWTVWGWLGVNLFFVISGFTIFHAHARDIGRPARLGRYAWRRVSRIYPIYWLFLAGFIAAAAVGIGTASYRTDAANVATFIALLPLTRDATLPLKVAWTLVYEMMFYIAFGLAIANGRVGRLIWPVWAVAIVVSSLVLGRTAVDPLNIWSGYFLLGAAMWWLAPRLGRGWVAPVAIALIVSTVLVLPNTDNLANQNDALITRALLPLMVPVTLALLTVLLVERHVSRALFARPPLLLLGNASYTLYLVHSSFLSAFAGVQRRVIGHVPGGVLFWVGFVGAVIAGLIGHLLIERPLMTRLRRARWAAATTASRESEAVVTR